MRLVSTLKQCSVACFTHPVRKKRFYWRGSCWNHLYWRRGY